MPITIENFGRRSVAIGIITASWLYFSHISAKFEPGHYTVLIHIPTFYLSIYENNNATIQMLKTVMFK